MLFQTITLKSPQNQAVACLADGRVLTKVARLVARLYVEIPELQSNVVDLQERLTTQVASVNSRLDHVNVLTSGVVDSNVTTLLEIERLKTNLGVSDASE